MSEPANQNIEDPLIDIRDNIKKFSAAVDERICSDDWKEDHVNEINDLRVKLLQLLPKVMSILR